MVKSVLPWLFVTLCGSMAMLSLQSRAEQWSYSVDYIQGEGDVQGIKLAAQLHTDWLRDYSEHLHVYFESSVNFWEYGEQNSHDTNVVLALSPVVWYPVTTVANKPLFVEFGIGISLLSDTNFAGKDVSTHYQFEDRLGLVYPLDDEHSHLVALRYFHYSNAGFKKPNPGLDFLSLSYLHYF